MAKRWHGPNGKCGCCCANLLAIFSDELNNADPRSRLNGGDIELSSGSIDLLDPPFEYVASMEINGDAGSFLAIAISRREAGTVETQQYIVFDVSAGTVFCGNDQNYSSATARTIEISSEPIACGLTVGNWHKIEFRQRMAFVQAVAANSPRDYDLTIFVDDVEIMRLTTTSGYEQDPKTFLFIPEAMVAADSFVSPDDWTTQQFGGFNNFRVNTTDSPTAPVASPTGNVDIRDLLVTKTSSYDADKCPEALYSLTGTINDWDAVDFSEIDVTIAGSPAINGTFKTSSTVTRDGWFDGDFTTALSGTTMVPITTYGAYTSTQWAAALMRIELGCFARVDDIANFNVGAPLNGVNLPHQLVGNYFAMSAFYYFYEPGVVPLFHRATGRLDLIWDMNVEGIDFPITLGPNAKWSRFCTAAGVPAYVDFASIIAGATLTFT